VRLIFNYKKEPWVEASIHSFSSIHPFRHLDILLSSIFYFFRGLRVFCKTKSFGLRGLEENKLCRIFFFLFCSHLICESNLRVYTWLYHFGHQQRLIFHYKKGPWFKASIHSFLSIHPFKHPNILLSSIFYFFRELRVFCKAKSFGLRGLQENELC